MTAEHPNLALLRAYEDASNRHDVEACVAMFNPDGAIELGERYAGVEAIRAAHEYDLASRTLVAFRECAAEGDAVDCEFWNQHELSRAVGHDGITSKARFTFRDGRIQTFAIFPPDAAERKRFAEAAGPALAWLRENHAETFASQNSFDRAGGAAVFALAELWRARQQA